MSGPRGSSAIQPARLDPATIAQKPSVGRMVHVVVDYGECYAAVITGLSSVVGSENVHLLIMPPGAAPYAARSIARSEFPETDRWHWPERA